MKNLKKISLSKLHEAQLDKKQQQLIFGGNGCKCGSCGAYASSSDNMNANFLNNITGTGSNDPNCRCSDGSAYSAACG